jgi:hypothetical protein
MDNADPPHGRPLMQFSLRSMFMITFVVAIASAAVSPWIRESIGWQAAAKWLFGYLTVVVIAACVRFRSERRAGPLVWRRDSAPWTIRSTFAVLVAVVLIMLVPPVFGYPFDRIALQSGAMSGFATFVVWWRMETIYHSLEVFERGMILNHFRFRPWCEVVALWLGRRIAHGTLDSIQAQHSERERRCRGPRCDRRGVQATCQD